MDTTDQKWFTGRYLSYRLIKKGIIREKTLLVADLKKCTKLWFINSVRKWLPVQLVEWRFELHC